MSLRKRIFLGILLVISVGFYFLVSWIAEDLKPQYRKTTEEPLVDIAHVLAEIAEQQIAADGTPGKSLAAALENVARRSFEAPIYDITKQHVDLHVYMTDKSGIVRFDSRKPENIGKDFSDWRDVSLTLAGKYGARTSTDPSISSSSSIMYVAAPITAISSSGTEEIIGVLSVGKPTARTNEFILGTKRRIVAGAIISCIVIALVAIFISGMITAPLERLKRYARAVRDGKRTNLPDIRNREIRELGEAFEEMRIALEGKEYVQNYVQTLTHEIKSPLAAIKGAAELLNEKMSINQRKHFLENISLESARIQDLIDRLLLLASLEKKRDLERNDLIDLPEMLSEVLTSLKPLIDKKQLEISCSEQKCPVLHADRFLVRHALRNLLDNSIAFSPAGGSIKITIKCDQKKALLQISDRGSGVPDYALPRIFERFFSLTRPETGRKSSGLGLSLVREVAELHGGSITLKNQEGGGTVAEFILPLRP